MVRFGKSRMVWFGESRFRKNGLVWIIKILIWFGLTYLKMIKLQVTGLTSLDISDNRIQIFSHRYFKIKKGVFDMLVVFCLSSPKYVLSSICHILSLSGRTLSYPFVWSYRCVLSYIWPVLNFSCPGFVFQMNYVVSKVPNSSADHWNLHRLTPII